MSRGFTLIELIVVVAVTVVLSAIILFNALQYITRGKDSNISGSLAVLVPAGEAYYKSNSYSYANFCDPAQNRALRNAISQMPLNSASSCYNSSANPAGVCCGISLDGNSWAACAREFANPDKAFCVDSKGIKREINYSSCQSNITECPLTPVVPPCYECTK